MNFKTDIRVEVRPSRNACDCILGIPPTVAKESLLRELCPNIIQHTEMLTLPYVERIRAEGKMRWQERLPLCVKASEF